MKNKFLTVFALLAFLWIGFTGMSCSYNHLPEEQAVQIQALEQENTELEIQIKELDMTRAQNELKLAQLLTEINQINIEAIDAPPDEIQALTAKANLIRKQLEKLAPLTAKLITQLDEAEQKFIENEQKINDLTQEGIKTYTQLGSIIANTFGVPAPLTKGIEALSPLAIFAFKRPRRLIVKAAKELPYVKEKPEDAADLVWQVTKAMQTLVLSLPGLVDSTPESGKAAEAAIAGKKVEVKVEDKV